MRGMGDAEAIAYAQYLISEYRPVRGGSLNDFVPELWSSIILEKLRKALVFGQAGVVNKDYNGEIQQYGDTVRINSISDPTISDYVKNTDLDSPETLNDSQKTLTITEAKSFNFQVDDIDKVQQNPKVMNFALGRAGYRLADVADQFIAAKLAQGCTENFIGTQASPIVAPQPDAGTDGAYELLVDLSVMLDEQNVPTEGRWAVIPPWYHGTLVKDQRFVSYAAVDVLYNRQIGEAAGFSIMASNNVPQLTPGGSGTAPTTNRDIILAGHEMAFSFAEQINSVEAYRPERRFADAVKGLHLYGGDVIRPEAVAALYCTRSNA
jgi:hypothetical protein